MTDKEIKTLLLYGAQLWPQTFTLPQTPDELDVARLAWSRQLGDLEAELVMAAMDAWGGHFPPTPHELREESVRLRALATGERIPDSDEAWHEFRRDFRMDYDGSHGWSHPCVARAARALGCRAYGDSQVTDEPTWRAQFRGFYEAAVRRHTREGEAMAPSVAAYVAAGALREAGPRELTP